MRVAVDPLVEPALSGSGPEPGPVRGCVISPPGTSTSRLVRASAKARSNAGGAEHPYLVIVWR
ncbi:MAG TPA: hypothetical protein VEV61_00555 [Streptosporangiaceae bacterium]|nr:hypothetical protein [Streptosporangiaceae bacterium]